MPGIVLSSGKAKISKTPPVVLTRCRNIETNELHIRYYESDGERIS